MTTEDEANLLHLGYPQGAVGGGYYVARASEGFGVVVAHMIGYIAIQYFPWGPEDDSWDTGQAKYESPMKGHTRFAKFLVNRAKEGARLDPRYPSLSCKAGTDLLTVKCLIEEGLAKLGEIYANDKTSSADASTTEDVG